MARSQRAVTHAGFTVQRFEQRNLSVSVFFQKILFECTKIGRWAFSEKPTNFGKFVIQNLDATLTDCAVNGIEAYISLQQCVLSLGALPFLDSRFSNR